MRRLDRGEAVDPAEHQAALAPAVREIVRALDQQQQLARAAGTTSRRRGGIDARRAASVTSIRPGPGAIHEFYALSTSPPSRTTARRRTASSRGRPDHLRRHCDPSRHRQPRPRWRPRGGGASCPRELLSDADRRAPRLDRGRADGGAGAARSTGRSSCRPARQVDDAFVPFMYDVMVPPATMDDYLAWAHVRSRRSAHAPRIPPSVIPRLLRAAGTVTHQRHPAARRSRNPRGLQDHLFEQANPRHEHSRRVRKGVELPAGQAPRRVISPRPTSSSIPSWSPSASSASRGSSARRMSSPARTAASPRARICGACIPRCGGPRLSEEARSRARRSSSAIADVGQQREGAGLVSSGPVASGRERGDRERSDW